MLKKGSINTENPNMDNPAIFWRMKIQIHHVEDRAYGGRGPRRPVVQHGVKGVREGEAHEEFETQTTRVLYSLYYSCLQGFCA